MYVLILFSRQRQGKTESENKIQSCTASNGSSNEKTRVLFLGHIFWMQDQIIIGQVRYFEAIEKPPRIDARSG